MNPNPFDGLLASVGLLLWDHISQVIASVVFLVCGAALILLAVYENTLWISKKINGLGREDRRDFDRYSKRYGYDKAVRSFRKKGKF